MTFDHCFILLNENIWQTAAVINNSLCLSQIIYCI